MSKVEKAYKNLDFLNSKEARAIRILCEYEEPKKRFLEQNITDTIVFFGSARAKPLDIVEDEIANLSRELARNNSETHKVSLEMALEKAKASRKLAEYYEKTRELARRLTEWDMKRMSEKRYYVCTGGGPGMMEAANRGASEVSGGRSIGLAISLPFEEVLNPYVSEELGFEFHYFFTRKYWFLYLCQAMVICPGGFGTMDEFFETLTLRQTKKIKGPLPTVLFGAEYWNDIMNIDKMAEWGTISLADLNLYFVTDSIDEAFDFLVEHIEKNEKLTTARS
jgi:uncharacterized protein (TIGR00730 family)